MLRQKQTRGLGARQWESPARTAFACDGVTVSSAVVLWC